MLIKIENYNITSELATFPLSAINNRIEIVANLPINTPMYLIINGFKKPYHIPFNFSSVSKDGNHFYVRIILTDAQIDKLRTNPTTQLSGKILINNFEIPGEFKITYNTQLLPYMRGNSVIASLVKDIADLRKEIYALSKTYPKFTPAQYDMPKGVIPVATGVGNEYTWDYPLKDVHVLLTKMSTIIAELSEQNKALTNRLNDLEQDVHDHIYEQYKLV